MDIQRNFDCTSVWPRWTPSSYTAKCSIAYGSSVRPLDTFKWDPEKFGFQNGQNLVWFNPHFTFFWLQLVTTLKVLHSQLLLVYHPPQLVQRCCHRGCWWPAPSARYRHPSTCAGAADKGCQGRWKKGCVDTNTHTHTDTHVNIYDR